MATLELFALVEIELDKDSAQILYWSLLDSEIPESSHTGIVYSRIISQLIEQGISDE